MPVTINGSGSTGSINTAVLPSSGTFATQSYADTAGGLVKIATETFSAVSSVSVNNCFTSTYDNYRMTLTLTAVSVDLSIRMRLRAAGSDNSTTNYDSQLLYTANGFVGGQQNTGTSGNTQWGLFGTIESDQPTASHMIADIVGPNLTAYTKISGSGVLYGIDTLTYAYLLGNLFKATTSFDGFSLLTSTGTISGTVRVYGYRN